MGGVEWPLAPGQPYLLAAATTEAVNVDENNDARGRRGVNTLSAGRCNDYTTGNEAGLTL
jgi:hypothetical protein